MWRLAKPVVLSFECSPSSPVIPAIPLENRAGQLFLGITEPACPEDFHLYRWQEDGTWELIFSAPGLRLGLSRTGYPDYHSHSFDDPYAQCLVFTLYGPDGKNAAVLLTVSYDGRTSRRITVPYPPLSRFPGGDFLLFGGEWKSDISAYSLTLQRFSPDGELLWSRSQLRKPGPDSLSGQWQYARALSDQTTLLYVEADHTCRLTRLDRNGEPLPTPALEELSLSLFPLPQVREEADGWVVEDCLVEYPGDSFALLPHHFRRVCFDRNWVITDTQTATLPSSLLPDFTFYPDGVLVGQFRTQRLVNGQFTPCCQINWLDLTTGQSSLLLTTRDLTPHLERPSLGLPLLRLEDGSFLFSLDVSNANAKGVLLAAAPDGQIIWMKKYRCEGNRWLFPKGDKLVAVWADFQGVRAETYRLPPSHSKEA